MDEPLNQTAPAEEQENCILQESEDEDSFDRLPRELVSKILDKVCEAKSLCRCSLVSKRFSSLVYQFQSASFKIPLRIPPQKVISTAHHLSLPGKGLRSFVNPVGFVQELLGYDMQSRHDPLSSVVKFDPNFIKFLGKFTSMTSLSVEISYSNDVFFANESIFKWNSDSTSSSFAMLFAKSLELAKNCNVGVDVGVLDPVVHDFQLLWTCISCYIKDASFKLSLMETLVPLLPQSLQNAVVFDSKKQGRLVLGEKNLVKMRNGNTPHSRYEGERLKIWYAPILELPMSGSVMKMVFLVICKDTTNDNGDDDYLIAKEAFEGEEEKAYSEAAKLLLNTKVYIDVQNSKYTNSSHQFGG